MENEWLVERSERCRKGVYFKKQGQRIVNENVTPKYNLALSQVFGDYSVLFTLYNTGELSCNCGRRGDSWLVRSTPGRVVRVRVLARDIVLCSWARHFTLTVPLSTQEYKYTLFQNGGHLNILLFLFKLALDASFLSLNFKRIFYLERGNKGQFVCA